MDLPFEVHPLTFQIALIGSDGLLVGSDRLQSYATPREDGTIGLVQRSSVCKFLHSPDKHLICFAAGGPTAELIARAIITKCDPQQASEETIWRGVLTKAADHASGDRPRIMDEVIVIRSDTPNKIWLVTKFNGDAKVTCIEEQICTGSPVPASFLPRHLWTRTTIGGLKSLALLTLAFAASEDPSAIGNGVDLLLLRQNGQIEFERHEESELRSLMDSYLPKLRL